MTSHMPSVTPSAVNPAAPTTSSSPTSSSLSSSTSYSATYAASSTRTKTIMESLLVAKMEQVAMVGPQSRPLLRTDSVDSASSLGSMTSNMSDVCRCDDCLLGIADLYVQESEGEPKTRKKFAVVALQFRNFNHSICTSNPSIKMDLTFNNGDPILFNMTIDSPIELSDNLLMLFRIHLFTGLGDRKVNLVEIKEPRGPCVFLKNNLGEIFVEAQRRNGYIVGSCPIRKGVFRILNQVVDMSQFKYSALPPGKVGLESRMIEKRTKNVAACSMTTAEIS